MVAEGRDVAVSGLGGGSLMKSPVQAMVWELWRLLRWEYSFRVIGLAAIGCILFSSGPGAVRVENSALPAGSGPTWPLMGPIVGMAMLMSLFSSVWMNSFDTRWPGFRYQLGFARPVRTSRMVGVPMLFITIAAGLTYLAPAVLVRWLFDAPVPVVSMSVLLMTVCASLVMVVWSCRWIVARIVGLWLAVSAWGVVGVFWVGRHPEGLNPFEATRENLRATFSFPAWVHGILLLCYVAAIGLCIVMVGRQRRGDGFEFPRALSGLFVRREASGKVRGRFGGPYRAEFWFGMRRSGFRVMLIGALFAAWVFAGVGALGLLGRDREALWIAWAAAIVLCGPLYMFIGTERLLGLVYRGGESSFSFFEAAQPVGIVPSLLVKLGVLALSVLVGWMAMLGTGAAWLAMCEGPCCLWEVLHAMALGWSKLLSVSRGVVVVMGVYAAVVLFVTGSALLYSLGLWLRRIAWVLGAPVLGCMGLSMGTIHLGWPGRGFWVVNAWMLAVALLGLAVFALAACMKRGYWGWKGVAVVLCAWGGHAGVVLRLVHELGSVPAPGNAAVLAVLVLPLAAVGWAPLSLAAHRHG